MMLFTYLLVMGALALVIQKCFDPPSWFYGADWVLTPLVVVYASIYMGRFTSWFFAVLLGVMTDLLSESRIGTGSFCLFAMTALIQTQKPEKAQGRWYLQMFLVLVGTMFFLILDYTGFCVHQKRWIWSTGWGVYQLMTLASLWNALMAPLVFKLFSFIFCELGCMQAQTSKEAEYDT